MRNPRSVILAVIPANVDIATQEILEMAEELDVKGERTLGVLTKPDLVDKGAEPPVIAIIEYVFSESIPLLLDQILSLETCFRSSCSVDMDHGSTMII